MNTENEMNPTSFKRDLLRIDIHPTQQSMAKAAAHAAFVCLESALANRGEAAVIFACATSQMQFLDELTAMPGLDWSRITMFHMDEYLGMPMTHTASFRRFLLERVVSKTHPKAVHYIVGDCLEPIAECDRYSGLLQEKTIDLCCCGIGENGHLAFNDPPVADFQDKRLVKIVKLDEASRQQQVGEGFYPDLSAVPQYAMTLTIPALFMAKTVLCVAPEKRKALAVKTALAGPIATSCPASHLRNQSHAILFLDAESASMLQDTR